MKLNAEDIQGREMIVHDVGNEPAIINNICQRCQARVEKWMCTPTFKYCWTCYLMGIVTDRNGLRTYPETNNFEVAGKTLNWEGTLTHHQRLIAEQLCSEPNANQLVHAVTGAGKTEMLYPVLEQTLSQKKRVAFVAPRVDVVHEIASRLEPLFNVTQTKMTGYTPEQNGHQQLVFATVHQLFKFKEAFDLVIVDECDAFPLHGNKWLYGAIQKAIKSGGRLICLTATLPKGIEKTFNIKDQNKLKLYRRFHGYPLPNIQIRSCGNWRKQCPEEIVNSVKNTKVPILLFVPNIKDCYDVKIKLEQKTDQMIGIAYAGEVNRLENIQAFKNGSINILVTTILLERGITFPGIDVMVLGAEDEVFTTATLVQIAGRCGRTLERPTGNVYVYSRWQSRKIKAAYQQIKRMNQ